MNTLDVAHSSRSEKYKVIPTKEIANRFKELGFVVDQYSEKRVKDPGKQGFQKHVVRLSNPSLLSSDHKDIKLQLLVTNSHDGTSSFKIQLGFFRFVCANGLVVGSTFENIRLRHSGNVIEQIDHAIERMVAQVGKLSGSIEKMKTTKLDASRRVLFFEEAIKLRDEKLLNSGLTVPTKRIEDSGDDVFTLYNRVQETLVGGGATYENANGRVRRLRAVKNIDRLVKVNEALFDLAVKYSEAA